MTRAGSLCVNRLATASRCTVRFRPPSLVLVCKSPPFLPLPPGEALTGVRVAVPSPSPGEKERNMKVGRIPYLSCGPFYFEMERRGMELYDLEPSALADAMAKGEIDAGLVSLVDCFRLSDDFRFLAGFCVATIRRAGGVLLHSKQPIEALSGARIGISGEGVTSFRL